jgi:hypothetical protein
VPESVIAAICLLGDKSVDEIVARLSPDELEQVIKIVGRSPSGYPPECMPPSRTRGIWHRRRGQTGPHARQPPKGRPFRAT